jgi:glyoxalase/bleomycin resistance protein/dioxygenase superfamily protein
MIRGLHGMFYTSQADELRAFLRDKLRLPHSDVGGGWLIFDVPEADIGVHPVEEQSYSGTHDISFWCDDIEGTVADLRSRGVEFEGEVSNQGWGSSITFTMPGGVRVQLYQPRYQKTTSAKAKPAASTKKSVAARPAAAKSARRKPAPRAKKAPARKAPARKAPVKKGAKRRR